MAKRVSRRRIYAMDELRGLLVLGMIVHHALYTVGYMFGVTDAMIAFNWISQYLHPIGATLFVLMCGISCHLSHSNWQRGLRLAAVAVAMSAVLYFVMPNAMIWFGILHCLAVCLLLYAAISRWLGKIPPLITLLVNLFLAVITWKLATLGGSYIGIPGVYTVAIPEALANQQWLMFTGLADGFGVDWFPLFPWLFVFLCGSVLGRWGKEGKFPNFLYKDRFSGLAWIGRHSLWIYLAHQPVIYGICWVVFKLI